MTLLLDSALKATLILLAAWTASLALRRASAGVRHAIWLAAILAVALLPAMLSIPRSAIPSAARIVAPVFATTTRAVSAKIPSLPGNIVPIVWAAGAIVLLARLALGIFAALRITRSARNLNGTLYSDRASTPLTWGILRPVVILPAYAESWTDQQRDPVIRHERAHIERHDWLWQMLSSALTAVFWFHPLMWLAHFQLRREAEYAADDLVLASGAAPSDYATRLVEVARRVQQFSVPAVAIPMVRRPELERRVRSILDPSGRRSSAGILVRSAVALAAAALLIPIGVTRQTVHAQGKVYKIGGDVSQPSILYKVEPEYTVEAREAKIEGAVRLQVEITPQGTAENIRVTQSIDPGLDDNAITAVRSWRFKPGKRDGEAVTVAAVIEVNFRLL
jgi:TonB family protein